jgi:glycosyltransferase involved in cell wall biosynthesis
VRICQLSNVELTYNFIAPLFHALRADGHEVVAACRFDRGGTYLERYLGNEYACHEVPAARAIGLRALTVDILELARYLRRERFDVVHVHGPLISMQARVAARLASVPTVIYQAHGFYFHEGMAPWTYRVARSVERAFCRHLTDIVITINREDYELARRGRFREAPSEIIYVPGVGIDTKRFSPANQVARAEGSRLRRSLVPPGATVIVFVGRLVAEKGVRELLTAFEIVAQLRPDVHLLVVGERHSSERDRLINAWLERFLADSAFSPRVKLLGRRADVDALLHASDIFVLPSYREGLPVSLLEAMATGRACVATDVRGCREALGGHAGILVRARDSATLAGAITTLVQDRPLREAVGRRARDRVLERFSIEHSVPPLVSLFRRLDRSAKSAPVHER